MAYPSWSYFPSNTRPPDWVSELVGVVSTCETGVSSNRVDGAVSSDAVLAELAPGLQALGYIVETGKRVDQKVRRPVLFGENGKATVTYDVDAAHEALGIVVEVEAGRGARNNAAYRDLVRSSLILDARFLVLLMPLAYRYGAEKPTVVAAYSETQEQLRAIYASRRLQLPFEGVLLVGY